VDRAIQPQNLEWLIADFAQRIPEVLHALVVSSDGIPVAMSDRVPPDYLEQLSAITSGLISLAGGAARIFDSGAVTQFLVAMQRCIFVIMAIDDASSLAVLTTAAADLDLVAYEMTMIVERARLATPAARGAGAAGQPGECADGAAHSVQRRCDAW